MNFNFKLKNGEIINVFLNDFIKDEKKGEYGVVSWNASKKSNEYKEAYTYVHKDSEGREFFNYKGEKVYMDEFEALTPEELINKIYSEEWLNTDNLTWTLMKYGIDSIRVIQPKKPMTGFIVGDAFFGFETSRYGEDKSNWEKIEYKFEETSIHKLKSNYKIKLTPANKEHIGVYASRDYYISDLLGLFRKCTDDYQLKLNKVA